MEIACKQQRNVSVCVCVFDFIQVLNTTDQHDYEQKLVAWERDQERAKVEFTITEKDLDADRRLTTPEVPENMLQVRRSNQGRTGSSNRPWLSRQTDPISSGVMGNSGTPA